jgi:hypothetical protein
VVAVSAWDTCARYLRVDLCLARSPGVHAGIEPLGPGAPRTAHGSEPPIRAIAGKQCRRTPDRLHDLPALQEVRVWASESRLILANQAIDTQSHEITAIPLLLPQLDIRGWLVTSDAVGCQPHQMREPHAEYVLALKRHQGTLAADGHDCFATAQASTFAILAPDDKGSTSFSVHSAGLAGVTPGERDVAGADPPWRDHNIGA